MRKNVWVKILAVFCLISFFSAWPGFPGNDSVSGEERTETAKAGTEEVKNVRVPGDIPAVAVEVNTDSQGISEKLSEVFYTVYTEDDILRVPVNWETESVNMRQCGVYTIRGSLKLPEGYEVGEMEIPQVQTTVSVQRPGSPDINTYYRLTAAGIYIFPWLESTDADSMEVYLKKDSGQWMNLTEEGFAFCDEDGLYLSNQSMVVGNTYSLLVKYGKKQTGTLRFLCQKDGVLKIYSYQQGQLGIIGKPETDIRSYDTEDEKFLSRCGAYAIPVGGSLTEIEKTLKETVRLAVSTAEQFENSAENPDMILESSWDMSEVDIGRKGVYQVTGTFVIPEGYQVADTLTLPNAYAYVSVQKKGDPQINTYSMPYVDVLDFPMRLTGFSAEELQNMQVYIRENKGAYQKVEKELFEITSGGIQLYYRELLKKGKSYDICAVYEKGSTGIYSFVYDDSFIVNEYWHERNFSDRDEKNLPDIIQKAPGVENPEQPEPTQTPVPSKKPAEEENGPESRDGENDMNGDQYTGDGLYTEKNAGDDLYSGSGTYTGSTYGTGGLSVGGNTVKDRENTNAKAAAASATEESTVTERSTDTITVISGQRLLFMIQENGCAKFEKQGISVSVPEETINTWQIGENDEIQVWIEKVSDAAFSLRIFVRGEEAIEIPGTVVEFPFSIFDGVQSPETVVAEDAEGNTCTVSYMEEQKILHVEIEKTGDFFLADGENLTDVSEIALQNENEMETDKTRSEKEENTAASRSGEDRGEEEGKTSEIRWRWAAGAAGLVILAGVLISVRNIRRKKRRH